MDNDFNILQQGMGGNRPPKKKKPVRLGEENILQNKMGMAPQQSPVQNPPSVALPQGNELGSYVNPNENQPQNNNVDPDTYGANDSVGDFFGASNTLIRNIVHGTALNLFKTPNKQDEAFPTAAAFGQLIPWFFPGSGAAKLLGRIGGKAIKGAAGFIGGEKAVKGVKSVADILSKNEKLQKAGSIAGKTLDKVKDKLPTTKLIQGAGLLGEKVSKKVIGKTNLKPLGRIAGGATAGAGLFGGQSAVENTGHLLRGDKSFGQATTDTGLDALLGGTLGSGASAVGEGVKKIGKYAAEGGKFLSKASSKKHKGIVMGQSDLNPAQLEKSYEKIGPAISNFSKKLKQKDFESFKKTLTKDNINSPGYPETKNIQQLWNSTTGQDKQDIVYYMTKKRLLESGYLKSKDMKDITPDGIINAFQAKINDYNKKQRQIIHTINDKYKASQIGTVTINEKAFKKDFPSISLGDDPSKKLKFIEKTYDTKNPMLVKFKQVSKIYKKSFPSRAAQTLNPAASNDYQRLQQSFATNFIQRGKNKIIVSQINVGKLKEWLSLAEKEYNKSDYSHIHDNSRKFFNNLRGFIQDKITKVPKWKDHKIDAQNFNMDLELSNILKNRSKGSNDAFQNKAVVSTGAGNKAGGAAYVATKAEALIQKGSPDKVTKAEQAKVLYENFGKTRADTKTPYGKNQPLYNTLNFLGNRTKDHINITKKSFPAIGATIVEDTGRPEKIAMETKLQKQQESNTSRENYVNQGMIEWQKNRAAKKAKEAAAKKAKEAAAKAAKNKK